MWFNSSKYRQKPNEPPSHRVTKTRVDWYLKGKACKIAKGGSVEDITLKYQSLHEVEFLKPNEQHAPLMLKLEPEIPLDTIELIRSLYRCDCKAFWNTGWLCSHVLAVMELLGQFRLTQALAILPTTKVSGGQRKIRGALHMDDPTSKTFTKGYLIPKILENPLYVIWWQVHEEFDITADGVTRRELIPGIIKGFCYGTKYKWRVKFSDGDQMYFDCEALVEMIISSRKRGLDVTNSAAAEKYRRCIFDCEADC